jgi:YidC/Oxa1 family membrane protein insertase
MYDLIAKPLEFFYQVWPSYAGAISLLTLSIMLILLPLTLKGTRSMLAMQKLQPELKKLQNKHRDDRQKLNEETMKFYKENNINPLSGCMPLLLQMPVFFLLYRLLYELLDRAPYGQDMGAGVARALSGAGNGVFEQFGVFYPRHIDPGSQLYQDLHQTSEMRSAGMNLAESAQQAIGDGLATALPYIILVFAVTATSFIQQRQISRRGSGISNPQQEMLMKIMPLFFAFISLTLPAGIVVYFLVSNLFRIAQQAFITRTMYRDESGAVETKGREIDESSTPSKGFFAQIREAAGVDNPPAKAGGSAKSKGTASTSKSKGGGGKATATKNRPASSSKAPARNAPSRTQPKNVNRSKRKKKRK